MVDAPVSNHLYGFLLSLLQYVYTSVILRDHCTADVSHQCLMVGLASLGLLAMPFLRDNCPSLLQGHIAGICSTCCPPKPPEPFLQSCFPACLICTRITRNSPPGAGLCTSFLLIIMGFLFACISTRCMTVVSSTPHSFVSSTNSLSSSHGSLSSHLRSCRV